jgi:hypothetical protein
MVPTDWKTRGFRPRASALFAWRPSYRGQMAYGPATRKDPIPRMPPFPIAACEGVLDGNWRRTRGGLLILAACTGLIACAPADTPNRPIFLPQPYNTWPAPLPDAAIEPGRPVRLDGPQQVAVTTGVLKWMKDPTSVQFRDMEAVQNSRGLVTVCGEVNGRNSAGKVSISPFIGILMGQDEDADFVLVGIGSTDRERAEVIQLCRQSGIYGVQ